VEPFTAGLDRLFGRLIRIGREPRMLPSEARYVVLTNIVALLAIVFTLGFAPVMLLGGHALYPAMQGVYALAYVPALWLNHRRHHVAATTSLLAGSHLAVLGQLLVGGRGYDVHLFLMLHAGLPFLLYGPRREALAWALTTLAGIELALMVVLGGRLPELGPPIDHLRIIRPILLAGLFATFGAVAYYARRATLIAEDRLDAAHQRSEELLLNILPPSIADRLKATNGTIADGFAEVSVLFADIVGFTKLSAHRPPQRVVELLNELFCHFDDLAGQLGLEKIKTIGDCYMVAAGLPEPRPDHAEAIAQMALAMIRVVRELAVRHAENLDVRIGIHSGPVVAGVIGKRKFVYDLWGDTVNTASRMESHGLPGAIQVSGDCRRLLDGKFKLSRRGEIEVKGKGPMETWLLEGTTESPHTG
jgi:class 3 adenylate cyclase